MLKYLSKTRTIFQKRQLSTAASVINMWKSQLESHVDHSQDHIGASQFNLLANTLDDPLTEFKHDNIPPEGTIIPPAWHLVYFPPRFTESELASDGYEVNFKPPKPFVHRMWAGAKLEWSRDNLLRVGQKATMKSKLADVQVNAGRRGESAFVWIDKDIYNEQGWSMKETRCLVYVQEPTDGGDKATPARRIKVSKAPEFSLRFDPTPMTLFRYSALTFNSHLIHYDHIYATTVEHHPGTFDTPPHIKSFQYKCLSPVYADQPFNVCGREMSSSTEKEKSFELWIADRDGNMAVKGTCDVQL
ncbi:hypothetical protein K450DRAFT_239818 [Umbelopsis ramanniana AG]|uniref:N-terminal of MaoC-like dehydratase domain-containing protein n=1 Tax=Umbelopsis ramanniana AG TaxID=1314678 RepID=A0AAD5ECX4_UMBRA|nr:uncharacterized protein K450DRAFT_239818 [Umbelopsis ramanniana AG]KAI8579940.1 hypothetical protein K450DRAFT_239818 [Umbelopsis ramanniana AG]